MELGKKKYDFFTKKYFLLCCGVCYEVVEQKATLSPSKNSVGRKNAAKKIKYEKKVFLS